MFRAAPLTSVDSFHLRSMVSIRFWSYKDDRDAFGPLTRIVNSNFHTSSTSLLQEGFFSTFPIILFYWLCQSLPLTVLPSQEEF